MKKEMLQKERRLETMAEGACLMENTAVKTNITKESAELLLGLLRRFITEAGSGDIDCGENFLPLCYLAKIHSLAPVVYYMLQGTGNMLKEKYPKEYEQLRRAYMISVARSVRQESARQEAEKYFRGRGLQILFFKGAQIREFYPVPELRTMGDMDALIRENDREKSHEAMLKLGYVCELSGGDVWLYRRGDIIIEMHTRVAGNGISNHFDYAGFFSDAMEHGIEENGRLCFEREYHFCYLIYHLAKHLSSTGAGIRMFLDIAVFLRHYGGDFDWSLADRLLKSASLERTAAAVFGLCERWFGTGMAGCRSVPADVLDELEDYVINGGIFGFETHNTGDVYRRKAYIDGGKNGKISARFRMWKDYLFPPAEYMANFLPAVRKHRWAVPAAWLRRWWIGAFRRRKHSLDTIHSMKRKDGDRSYREYRMLKKLGL